MREDGGAGMDSLGAHTDSTPTWSPAAMPVLRPGSLPTEVDKPSHPVLSRRTAHLETSQRPWPATPKQRAQAERLWALDMATRGIDIGPSVIHGVHLLVTTGSRTHRVEVAV